MSEQGQKQEDISAHKSSRTAPAIPPPLGPSPPSSLLAYPHEYSAGPHHRLYTMMRPGAISIPPQMTQPIQSAKPCLTNDMGPPIFMPSLNLGTPKGSAVSAASSPLASSSATDSTPSTTAGPNTTVAGSPSSAGGPILAHSMSDMILSNAPSVAGFHSLHNFYPSSPGIRPVGSGKPQYISIPTAPPQVSAVVSNKRPISVTATIAKPTPIQGGHASKVGTFAKSHPGHPPREPPTSKRLGTPPPLPNKAVMLVSSSPGLIPAAVPSSSQTAPNFPPGSSVIKQPTASQVRQSHHHHHHSHAHQQQQGTSVTVHPASHQPAAGKQSKLYINAPPLPPPTQQDGNTNPSESMGPVFFAHPTMQGHVIPVAAYPTMIQTHGAGSNVQPPPPPSNAVTSSTLTELLAPTPTVVSSSLREGGGGKQAKVHDGGMRSYSPIPQQQQQQHSSANRYGPTAQSLRERSSSGDGAAVMSPQTAGSDLGQTGSHSSTAQPATTADRTDTRVERPSQLPSGSSAATTQLPSPQGVPSPYQGPHRERSNSTEVSNIIISMPGLTGRHIAAISGNQAPGFPPNGSQPQQQQQLSSSSDPYRGSRVKSEYGSGGQVIDSSLLAPSVPPSTSHPCNTGSVGGGRTSLPPAPTFGQLAVAQAALTATVISSSSSSSSSSSVNSPGAGPHPNSLPLAAAGSPLANLSPSRRPSIIRKRPHERSSMPLLSPGHTPRADHGPSHPLSPPPPSSLHSPRHGEPLTNHVAAAASTVDFASSGNTGDVLPSPRKKRRKQDVIATDDQYASNVPNNVASDVAMAMDGDHHSSQGSMAATVTRARGRADDTSTQREDKVVPPNLASLPAETEKVEVQYLSQLRQPQWPINGMYCMHYRAAHNHFKRHADIKHIETATVTATGIANNKTAIERASGWKIYRMDPQIGEMLQVETDILEMVRRVERSVSNLSQCASCPISDEVTSRIGELVQGNIARSSRIVSHLETTRSKMIQLLEHKPTVMDLLLKYSTSKHYLPINSLSHKPRT